MQRSSVRPSVLSFAAARRCCGFAAERPAGRRYRSIAARTVLSGGAAVWRIAREILAFVDDFRITAANYNPS